MIQARQEMRPSTFIPPKWAHKYTRADLPHRLPDMDNPMENFWYLELGGEYDAIADTEWLRDELLRMAYGIWDFVKNDPELREKNANWRLDWVGILPGKRESRRYVGDHILTQHDVRAGGHFDDLVAYGGWSMDDHHPGGFRSPEQPTIYHPAPSPYGIPYRCLYSVNIDNLFCAGRNISVTHTAMSSTRVMATCATLGQAVGTAAAIAALYGLTPRGVYEQRIAELQQTLMDDDCYLPFRRRAIPALTRNAALACDSPEAENLRNGFDRALDGAYNGVAVPLGSAVAYTFPAPEPISRVRVVLDSDLNRDTLPECERRRERNMLHNRPLGWPDAYVPTTLLRAFRIEGVRPDGTAETLYESQVNHRRLISVPVDGVYAAVRLVPLATWGDPLARIFSFDVC